MAAGCQGEVALGNITFSNQLVKRFNKDAPLPQPPFKLYMDVMLLAGCRILGVLPQIAGLNLP